jgi:uncharacterized metal-binding protein/rhodanese-related sulfurtransferase
MDCTKCTTKGCRDSQPCLDRREEYLHKYAVEDNQMIVRSASELVDYGRAGLLNRLEEIVEYAKSRNYKILGVAYCYGLEKEAKLLQTHLSNAGFQTAMISCTVDGVTEADINPAKTSQAVSCNPIGQANVINGSGAEFTILMGLCLGHDILIQKQLNMDFTTWLVKDRVSQHRPLDGLPGYHSTEDLFLENMDNSFRLIPRDLLKEKIHAGNWQENLVLLDLRGEEVFAKNGIPGSIQCLLNQLPQKYKTILPDKNIEIVVYCNGGMQSLYAVMYLSLKGYRNVKSLAGGYSDGAWALQA